jgi:hypothetical protein
MIDFIHDSTLLVTQEGLKPISQLRDDDMIVCINRYGCMEYYSPVVEVSDEMGMYYNIKTDMGDLNLSANCDIYYNGNYKDKLSVHEVASTLVGNKIKITAVPFRSNYWGTGKPINDTMLYVVKNLKCSKPIYDNYVKVYVRNKVSMEIMDELLEYHRQKNNLDWSFKLSKNKKTKIYYFYAGKDFKKGISYKLPAYSGVAETKKILDLFIFFDNYGNTRGARKVLVEECNAHIVLTLALKAGNCCYIGKDYIRRELVDYVYITRKKAHEVRILDSHLMQNENYNHRILLPERYYGFACVSDGLLYIHAT